MHSLRHLLLVILLVGAQLLAGAHAVAHAAGDDEALASHTCELCLAAHDLGSALPSALPPLLPATSALPPDSLVLHGRTAFPPPSATQGAPPRF